jgi:hypothetical protein
LPPWARLSVIRKYVASSAKRKFFWIAAIFVNRESPKEKIKITRIRTRNVLLSEGMDYQYHTHC